jgi:hypothetical protein
MNEAEDGTLPAATLIVVGFVAVVGTAVALLSRRSRTGRRV